MIDVEVLKNGNVKLSIPMSFRNCSGRKRIITPETEQSLAEPLLINLARAFRWQKLIDSGVYRNAVELAKAIGKDHAFVARTTRLTLLAPEIVHAILAGTLKRNIPIENFRKEMPIRWEDQKKLFDFK